MAAWGCEGRGGVGTSVGELRRWDDGGGAGLVGMVAGHAWPFIRRSCGLTVLPSATFDARVPVALARDAEAPPTPRETREVVVAVSVAVALVSVVVAVVAAAAVFAS